MNKIIKKITQTFLLFPIVFYSTYSCAEQEFILGLGKGMDDTLIQSKSISNAEQAELAWSYKLTDFEIGYPGTWEWWFQAGVAQLEGEYQDNDVNITISHIKPIIRWYPKNKAGKLFYEAGVGLAHLSEREFKKIKMPTNINFSVHLAAGWRVSDAMNLSLRYNHFSNGFTHNPNPGLDYLSLNFHWVMD